MRAMLDPAAMTTKTDETKLESITAPRTEGHWGRLRAEGINFRDEPITIHLWCLVNALAVPHKPAVRWFCWIHRFLAHSCGRHSRRRRFCMKIQIIYMELDT